MINYTFKAGILIVPVIINTPIFIILSLVHFYWAVGGKLWYQDALPTSSTGLNKLTPGITATLVVALGLLLSMRGLGNY